MVRQPLVTVTVAIIATGALQIVGPAEATLGPGTPSPDPAANVRHVFHDGRTTGGHVTVEGQRLYMGAYGKGFRMFDIGDDPLRPREIGAYLPGGRADAVPDAAVFDGRHIAVLNGTGRVDSHGPVEGTDTSEFLDVTDPANPRLLWKFVGPDDGEAHNGDIVDERRLWLPSGGPDGNGLRIYDLDPLLGAEPEAPENLFRGDPVELWKQSPHRGGREVGAAFTHTHDVSVYPDYPVRQPDGTTEQRDIVLLAEGGGYGSDGPDYGNQRGNTGSVFVIDITDPRSPVVLQRWLHERGDGHHPIRYHHEAQFLDGDPRLMLVTDEDLHHPCGQGTNGPADTAGGGVVAVRLSDTLTGATEESEWFIPAGTVAPLCSVHVMSSKRRYLFLGSYNAGLQVVDYADPRAPRQVGAGIEPGATSWGAYVHRKGVVYVGDMSRGLDVFVFEPMVPRGHR